MSDLPIRSVVALSPVGKDPKTLRGYTAVRFQLRSREAEWLEIKWSRRTGEILIHGSRPVTLQPAGPLALRVDIKKR